MWTNGLEYGTIVLGHGKGNASRLRIMTVALPGLSYLIE